MEPIPTYWRGRYFRSRLEARWAVFFDSLGIEYEYEKEGYRLRNGLLYLCDFWLPEQGCWIEIKPCAPTEEEYEKARSLVNSCGLSLYMTIQPIGYVPPWPTEIHDPLLYNYGDDPPKHIAFFEEDVQDEGYLWTKCPLCRRVGIQFEGRSHRLCGCKVGKGKEGRSESRSDELLIAYANALAERFDKPWKPPMIKGLRATGSLG